MNRSDTTHRVNSAGRLKRRVVHMAVAITLTVGSNAVLAQEQPGTRPVPGAGPWLPIFAGVTLEDGLFDPLTIRESKRVRWGSTAAPPQDGWARRHPVLLGSMIGLGTGLFVEGSGCGLSSCRGRIAAPVTGAGAYGGLVASAIQKARAKQPISKPMKAGLIGGTVGVIVGSFLFCYGAGGCGGFS